MRDDGDRGQGHDLDAMLILVFGTLLLPPVGLLMGAVGLSSRSARQRTQGLALLFLGALLSVAYGYLLLA